MIYIDAMPLVPEKVSGVGQYVKSFVAGLEAAGVEYRLFVTKGKKQLLLDRCPERLIVEIPHRFKFMKLLDAIGLAPRIDTMIGEGTYFFGAFQNWPLTKRSVSLTCFHDMAFVDMPQTVDFKNLITLRYFYKRWYKRSSIIVTVSKFSKDRIQSRFKNKRPVYILENTINTQFIASVRDADHEVIVRSYGIHAKNYLLYVGNVEPRKGLEAFFNAYNNQPVEWKRQNPVVMVGGMGWKNKSTLRLIDKINADEPYVTRPNRYVIDEDLASFYYSARAVLMPSLYEGYGIPIIESAATGKTVLATDIPPFIEVFAKYGFSRSKSFIMNKEYSLEEYAPAMKKMALPSSEGAVKSFLREIGYVARR